MQNFDRNIGFWEKRQFFRRKLSKIAENCDRNIDPWNGFFSSPIQIGDARSQWLFISDAAVRRKLNGDCFNQLRAGELDFHTEAYLEMWQTFEKAAAEQGLPQHKQNIGRYW
jgi:hypothetical protein